jgi:hypothetical protein
MPTIKYISESSAAYHAAITLFFGVLLAGYLLFGIELRQDFFSIYLLAVFSALLLLPILREFDFLGLKFKTDRKQ